MMMIKIGLNRQIDNQIDRHLDEGVVLEQKNTLMAPIRINSFQAVFFKFKVPKKKHFLDTLYIQGRLPFLPFFFNTHANL